MLLSSGQSQFGCALYIVVVGFDRRRHSPDIFGTQPTLEAKSQAWVTITGISVNLSPVSPRKCMKVQHKITRVPLKST